MTAPESWGSRTFYTWTGTGRQLARQPNPSHFIDYQDCAYAAHRATMERQIPAGLNMAAAGYPYWTVDAGGFFFAPDPSSQKASTVGGNVAAMARTAKLLMAGIGTDPDTIEAAAWYFLARRDGLRDDDLEDLLRGLTEEEQKRALERANRLR